MTFGYLETSLCARLKFGRLGSERLLTLTRVTAVLNRSVW